MENKAYKILSYVLVALVSVVLTLFVMLLVTYQNTGKLDQLENLINNKFIGEVDQEAMEDAMAGAMVDSLGDRWSYYLTAEEYADYMEQMNNSYVGIGITIQQNADGKGLDVLEVTAGGPAQEAGVLAGDIITAVDGKAIAGLAIDDVRPMIRGEEGTTVELTLLRGEEQLKRTVTRKLFNTPVATYEMLEGNIGLVTIENFDARCAQETIAAIEELKKQGAVALIFDVRFNPGGYKHELVDVLDYLLPEGVLFRSEMYDGTTSQDTSDPACLKMPMAVLVNGDSYSAAEFFAAALDEYNWATVVGQQTVGKGYFQSTFQLSDGSAVGLSIGKYYTPKGVSLAGVGITPDVVVDVDDETYAKLYYNMIEPMEDPQILAAMEALKVK